METYQALIKTAGEQKPVWFGEAGKGIANEYASFIFALQTPDQVCNE
jgi:hypothetical protein